MSEQDKQEKPASPTPAKPQRPETQGQRWVKYGSNVALAIVLIIVIAGLLTYIAQRNDKRLDTTAGSVYSLKPQTRAVISSIAPNPQHGPAITLVSLYTHTKPQQAAGEEGDAAAATSVGDQAQMVADLLDEYKSEGRNIDVQVIDPVNEKDKLAKLHEQLVHDYGSQIQGYKDFLAEWDKYYKDLASRMAEQADAMTKVTGGGAIAEDEDAGGNEIPGLQARVIRTVKALPKWLADMKEEVDRERAKKYPDWKAAANTVKDYLQKLSQTSGAIAQQFAKFKDNPAVPGNARQFMTQNQPRYEQMKKDVDVLIEHSSKLGELKVDQLEQALNVQNPILVLGPNDWRVLQYNAIWPEDTELRNMLGAKVRPRFAGEQQVTAAIYSLTTNKKPKLCFVRPGGEPVTSPGFPPFMPSGTLSQIAERMRQYNFEILEKDLSGTWAMQAQMRRMPAPPEPTDAEIKDAIWVVLDGPRQQQQQEGMPPVPIAPKVKDHLDHGGSALIMFEYQGEDLKSALDSWGIDLHPEAMAMHQALKLSEGSPSDIVEEAKTRPPLFVLKDYGDHEITRPLKNLDSIWIPTMVVRTHDAKDVTVTPLCPMDGAFPGLKVWGETEVEAMRPDNPPTYDKDKDLAPPIYGAAAAEKKGGGRLVVMGSPIMFNGRINIPDPAIAQKQHRYVSRFPGNGELSANSFFWLAHLEPLIAISPAAMDVNRLGDVTPFYQKFWYVIVLGLLPIAVLASGVFVWVGRRG